LKEVLDTRFLVEYFYSNDPATKSKTAQKLKELLAKHEGILPTIVIAEIIQLTCERRGKAMAESRYQTLLQSGLRIQDLTPQIAKQTGLLKSQYKNVPIGDCIIAAIALANHAKLLSDDPHFDALPEIKRVWI
jgi:predicted nucleic acid-binding protein